MGFYIDLIYTFVHDNSKLTSSLAHISFAGTHLFYPQTFCDQLSVHSQLKALVMIQQILATKNEGLD